MNIKHNLSLLIAILLVSISATGCDMNPSSWAEKTKQSIDEKITTPATAQEKAEFLDKLPKQTLPAASACSSDPALILCKTYPSVDAMLSDPNVKKFGFAISVDNVVVRPGLKPDIKYRKLKDGSIIRG